MGGLGGMMASGLAFGAGAGLAHGAVNSLMGGGGRGGSQDMGSAPVPYGSERELYGAPPVGALGPE